MESSVGTSMDKGKYIISFGLAIFVIAITLSIYWGAGIPWRNQYDDSYITYRYAINLSIHKQLVFNLNEYVDAASSCLYAVILSIFYSLGFHDLEVISFLLNMFSLGIISAFVYLSAYHISNKLLGSIILGLISSLHGFISGWSLLGMETICFTALLCAFVWAIVTKHKNAEIVLLFFIILMRFESLLIIPFWLITKKNRYKSFIIMSVFIILFYISKYIYYETWLPHSYIAKKIILYYNPDPMQIISIWNSMAISAIMILFMGLITTNNTRWLSLYILFSFLSCLLGPRSDWVRYTIHLFPLCLIVSSHFIKMRSFAMGLFIILLLQCYYSNNYMYYNIHSLKTHQIARLTAGEWLMDNADKSKSVISGDIGAIAYRAIDMKFIDVMGLTSLDIQNAYKNGESINNIIQNITPCYLADTFIWDGNNYIYNKYNASFIKNGKSFTLPLSKLLWGQICDNNIMICIGEISQ